MKALVFFLFCFSSSIYADLISLEPQHNAPNSFVKFGNLKKYYESVNKKNNYLLKFTGEVNVIYTPFSNYSEKFSDLYESKYALIGHSKFYDRKIPEERIKSYAREVKASVVLVSAERMTTNQYSSNDDLNELDHGYSYFFTFWQKSNAWNQPNILGIQIGEIPREEKTIYQRNTGNYVSAVIKNSRAYYSNILIGDVIIAINGYEVLNKQAFSSIKNRELDKSKTLNLTILRIVNNVLTEVQIPLNFK